MMKNCLSHSKIQCPPPSPHHILCNTCTHICTHTHYTGTHTHTTHVHTHTHTLHMYTHIHTHTHTYTTPPPLLPPQHTCHTMHTSTSHAHSYLTHPHTHTLPLPSPPNTHTDSCTKMQWRNLVRVKESAWRTSSHLVPSGRSGVAPSWPSHLTTILPGPLRQR